MVAVIRKGLERFGDEEEGKFCHWKIMGSLSWLLVSFYLLHRFCFRFFDLLCSLWRLGARACGRSKTLIWEEGTQI
jgi:hypothetical protein